MGGKDIKLDTVALKKDATADEQNQAIITAINAKIGETGVLAVMDKTAGKINLTQVKDGVAMATADIDVKIGATAVTFAAGTTSTEHISDVDVSTLASAQKALSTIDNALGSINSTRADLGAIQNRFTSVVANLQTSSENMSASRSRIKDTDFAKETAELTRRSCSRPARPCCPGQPGAAGRAQPPALILNR